MRAGTCRKLGLIVQRHRGDGKAPEEMRARTRGHAAPRAWLTRARPDAACERVSEDVLDSGLTVIFARDSAGITPGGLRVTRLCVANAVEPRMDFLSDRSLRL